MVYRCFPSGKRSTERGKTSETHAPIVEIRRMANKRIYRGSQVERRTERLDFVIYLSTTVEEVIGITHETQ